MTKFEWERQLKKGISGLPKTEQQRVLDYYNELFADKIDAGLREQYIISEFGNPYDVANKILVDYYNEGKDNPAVDEYIYSSSDEIDAAFDDVPEIPAVVETPKRKTFAERREERREEQRARHEEHREEHREESIGNTNSKSNSQKNNRATHSANGLIAVLCVLAYFVMGACFNLWHPTWLIFLLIPCIITLIEAINKHNWRIFAYPVFVAFLYLLMGFYAHNWHPAWVLFITIPVYYVLGNFISKNTNGNKNNKNEKQPHKDEQTQEPAKELDRVEKNDSKKRKKSNTAADVITIIAKVLMTICLVWVSVVVWGFVISLLCGGIGMIAGGVVSLIAAAANGVNMIALGIGLAELGLGIVCVFGMIALIKPCFNMCKTFIKTIKKSFDDKATA